MRTALPALRAASGALAIAVALATFGAYLQQSPPQTVLAPACPAAAELAGVVIARMWPSAPLGLVVLRIEPVITVIGLAALLLLLARLTASWIVAVAIAGAMTALPLFSPVLAPLHGATFAVVAVTMLLLVPQEGTSRSPLPFWSVVALVCTAAVVPAATLPLAGLGAWLTLQRGSDARPRPSHALLVAAMIAASAVAVRLLLPTLPSGSREWSCLVPATGRPVDLLAAIAAPLKDAGPYVCGLALLAVVACRKQLAGPAARPVIAYGAILAVAGLASLSGPTMARVPLTVALWVGAAVGLRELVRGCRRTTTGHVAATVLVVLVPLLAVSARIQQPVVTPPQFGHAALSRAQLAQLLDRLPPGAGLVSEDAVVDVLLRSRAGGRIAASDALHVIPRVPAEIAAELRAVSAGVFALPLAQEQLQQLGMRLTDVGAAAGLARVDVGGDCRPLRGSWRTLPNLRDAQALTMAAQAEGDTGPVVAYLTFDVTPSPAARTWPARALRGFNVTLYDLSNDRDWAALRAASIDDQAPLDVEVASRRGHVLRLEQWRTPGAPLALTTEFRAAITGGVARSLAPEAGTDRPTRLSLCPAFPHEVRDFDRQGSRVP
ncbi:MAG: hypothetical protein ABI051_08465 [Vicinamibacterales bacterium]